MRLHNSFRTLPGNDPRKVVSALATALGDSPFPSPLRLSQLVKLFGRQHLSEMEQILDFYLQAKAFQLFLEVQQKKNPIEDFLKAANQLQRVGRCLQAGVSTVLELLVSRPCSKVKQIIRTYLQDNKQLLQLLQIQTAMGVKALRQESQGQNNTLTRIITILVETDSLSSELQLRLSQQAIEQYSNQSTIGDLYSIFSKEGSILQLFKQSQFVFSYQQVVLGEVGQCVAKILERYPFTILKADRKQLRQLYLLCKRCHLLSCFERLFIAGAVDTLIQATQTSTRQFLQLFAEAQSQLKEVMTCVDKDSSLSHSLQAKLDQHLSQSQPNIVLQVLDYIFGVLMGDERFAVLSIKQLYSISLRLQASAYFLDCLRLSIAELLFFSRYQDYQIKQFLFFLRKHLGSAAVQPHFQLLQDQSWRVIDVQAEGADCTIWAYSGQIWPNTSFDIVLPLALEKLRDKVLAHCLQEKGISLTILPSYSRVVMKFGHSIKLDIPLQHAAVLLHCEQRGEVGFQEMASLCRVPRDRLQVIISNLYKEGLIHCTPDDKYRVNRNAKPVYLQIDNPLRQNLPSPPRSNRRQKTASMQSLALRLLKQRGPLPEKDLLGLMWRQSRVEFQAGMLNSLLRGLEQRQFVRQDDDNNWHFRV